MYSYLENCRFLRVFKFSHGLPDLISSASECEIKIGSAGVAPDNTLVLHTFVSHSLSLLNHIDGSALDSSFVSTNLTLISLAPVDCQRVSGVNTHIFDTRAGNLAENQEVKAESQRI